MTDAATTPTVATAGDFERTIGRVLTTLTYIAVALLVVGVVLMALGGVDPLSTSPRLDPSALVADLLAFRPSAFLWLGLIAVIVSPVSRVVVAGIGFARRGEGRMAAIAGAVVIVIAIAVLLGVAT